MPIYKLLISFLESLHLTGAGSKIPKMIVDCMTICFAPPSSNATNATSPANPTNATNADNATPATKNLCEACINNKGMNY